MTAVRVLASRWGTWWFLACLAAIGVFQAVSSSCAERAFGDDFAYTTCEGFSRTVYDSLSTFQVVAFAAAIFGAAALDYFQRMHDTRPCPRCGERVYLGEMECGPCGFDFRTVGR